MAVAGLCVWGAVLSRARGPGERTDSVPDLRVATLNLGDAIPSGASAAEVLARLRADLVVLQEVAPHQRAAIEPRLLPLLPHQAWRAQGLAGKAALSRFPILAERAIESADGAVAQELVLDVRGRSVAVLNVHASAWSAGLGRWTASARAIERWAERGVAGADLALLAGDLNGMPSAALTGAAFRDAHLEAGNGFGWTFPVAGRYRGLALPPLLRVDRVWVRGEVRVVACRAGADAGSDHLPVVADFALPAPDRR